MDEQRARELVARERARVESMLAQLSGAIRAEGPLQRQQTGEYEDAGTNLEAEDVDAALAADLREQLAAVDRAEERLAQGTFGRSIESGMPIPDERLEAEPLAERTVEERDDSKDAGVRRGSYPGVSSSPGEAGVRLLRLPGV
jgi:DnaK suppressor protein